MSHPVGIDLGTTNSVVCVWRRGGIETIPVDGRPTLPSAISVTPDGVVLVGKAAKARAMLEPLQSITSAKRCLGDGKTEWTIGGKTYRPADASALVLRRLKEAAEAYLGEPVREAVITVPAYFTSNQKLETKLAGEQAGLAVLQLLPEPTAAAIAYGLDKGKDQTLLVYDLGGGTFDVSVLKVKGNRFEVVAVDGDFRLGGDDFDAALVEHLLNRLQRQIKADLGVIRSLMRGGREVGTPLEMLLARQRLKEAAERAKIELSESDSAQVTIPDILGTSLDVGITLAEYNRLISPLVDRTLTKMRDVLKAAKYGAADIDRVILVGGSTRNALVRERVANAVKEPWISDRVDEVVAQGAAIVAGSLSVPDVDMAPEEALTPIEFQNVTPFSLGVRASKGQNLDLFQPLITRNATIPTVAEREFTTFRTNQKSVDVSVFQGEKPSCRENTFLGGFRLDGIPAAPAGQPRIMVQFEMNGSDLLSVTASCSHLRSEQTLDVNMVSREDEMPQAAPTADIIFLIDTSGSMSRELDGVKQSCLDFAKTVMNAGVDCRIGLMDFDLSLLGALQGNYKWELFGPMAPAQFPPTITKLSIGRLGGVGCYIGAANTIPVIQAFTDAFPGDRIKIGILISDEVGNDAQAVAEIVSILQRGQVCLHVVGVAKSCHVKLAAETGGRFWDIHSSRGKINFGDLLDQIAGEITNLALA